MTARVLALAAGLLALAATSASAHEEAPEKDPARAWPSAPSPHLDGPRTIDVLAHARVNGDRSGNVVVHDGHAYLGSYGTRSGDCEGSGVRVFDLRRPRRPLRVATFAAARTAFSLAGTYTDQVRLARVNTRRFRGTLAAVGFQRCRPPWDGFQGFGVYDVTRPARPRLLALVNVAPAPGAHELWLQARGEHAYAFLALPRSELVTSDGPVPGRPDLRVVDVSDPRRPREVGAWGIWSDLGVRPRVDSDPNAPNDFAHSVITNRAGTRAFVSYWDFGTVILDVRRPSRPRFLGRTESPGGDANAHSAALADGERLLVETQEHGSFLGVRAGGYPHLYDVSSPRRPVFLSRYAPLGTETSTVHDPKARGRHAYLSWYDQGVAALDVSEPTAPRPVARFLPPDGESAFVWGVALGPDYLVASDMATGLWVLDVRCSVPDLAGRTLAQARALARAGDCSLGRVRGRHARDVPRGRVLSQSAAPGSAPPYPSRIDVVVSLGAR
jgi:hypothetical protein